MQITPIMRPLRKAALPLAATAAMFLSACAKETHCHTVDTYQYTNTSYDSIPAGVDTAEYLNMMERLGNLPRLEVESNLYTIVCD